MSDPATDPIRQAPKPPEAKVSLSDIEAAERVLGNEPDGEASVESAFAKDLDAQAHAINQPESETLRAMEKPTKADHLG